LKFRFGDVAAPALYEGVAQGFGGRSAQLEIRDASGTVVEHSGPGTLQEAGLAVLRFIQSGRAPLGAIGHRFVHGGPDLLAHRLIDPTVRAQLNDAAAFSPLHNPPALEILALAQDAFPVTPQVVCLDTAFHATMPEKSKRFALPRDRLQRGLHRYGFHGLSCESIVRQLGSPPPRLVIAHLGGGASVTAVHDGLSVDTTMGLTPDGGVMMQTRSGDLDPGLLLYLLRHGETVDTLEQLLTKASGIAGVSGHGGDLRDLRAANDRESELAIEMFTISVAKAVASMGIVLGGLDMLVFTGGIGEHDKDIRAAVAERIACIGSPMIKVLAAEEEFEISRHTARLVGSRQ
jgi:acetate kinase